MKMKAILAIITLFVLIAKSIQQEDSDCKLCSNTHPQDIFCHSDFVGVVRITEVNTEDKVENKKLRNKVAAELTILKIYKGKYEDFAVGSSIYLYVPANKGCQREYWEDDFMISGTPYLGGLLSSKCDFRESLSTFSAKQVKAIQSHIHNRAYAYGCKHCTIKKPYDYSALQINQCRHKYDEFPISTSACVPSAKSGHCKLVANSRERYVLPRQPKAQKKTLPPRDYILDGSNPPQEGGCLYNRIKEEAKTATPPPENANKVAPTKFPHFIFSNSSPKNGFVQLKSAQPTKVRRYKMKIDWSKFKKST